MDSSVARWYSFEWFDPAVFAGFDWARPWVFYTLLFLPLVFIVRWLWRQRFSQKLPVAIGSKDLRSSPSAWLRFLPELLFIAVFSLCIVALARPQKTNERIEQWTEGIDIMLALDISESMQIEDFRPNRLSAAKQVAGDFIQGRLHDRIGIVVFSGDAFSLAPLTTDYSLLESYLQDISFDMIGNRGTAIGSALAVVTNRMRESTAKSKVCILLSDGDNNAGNIDPITAAKLASAYGIKTYTILIGKEGLVPFGRDIFGRPRMMENTVDESNLRQIANIGRGRFYRVTDNAALQDVFDRIDTYEKAEIKESRFRNTSDYYYIYLNWAIALLIVWLLTKSTFLTNVLQD